MHSIFDPQYLSQLCKKYHLAPSRRYGQNFLIDEAVIEKIVEVSSIGGDDTIIEVGPGFGTLTFALAAKAQRVIAFEIEKKLQLYWEEQMKKYPNVEMVWGNVLRELDTVIARSEERATWQSLGSQKPATKETGTPVTGSPRSLQSLAMTPFKVIANLPYHITSPLIRLFLEHQHPPSSLTLMVQKEVAERICAKPGDMSLLAVAVQYYAAPEYITTVPRSSFWPSPQVDSAVIQLSLRGPTNVGPKQSLSFQNQPNFALSGDRHVGPMTAGPPRDDSEQALFFRLVKIGFANRRKLLIKNLGNAWRQVSKQQWQEIFDHIGLTPSARAQELSVEEWRKIAAAVGKLSPLS